MRDDQGRYAESKGEESEAEEWVDETSEDSMGCGQLHTSFSESPLHLDTMELAEMLKKVVLHSVATALASKVLPVPGGPYTSTPFHGCSSPVKYSG